MGEYAGGEGRGSQEGVGALAAGGAPVCLTSLGHQYLDQTRPWVRFMSIVVFVMAGLMVMMGLAISAFALIGGLGIPGAAGPDVLAGTIGAALLGVFYVVIALVYIIPGVYLSRYADAIKRLQPNGDAGPLEDALKHQKSFWRFVGVLTAIGLVLGVVVLVLAVIAGAAAAVMGVTGTRV